MSQVTIEPLDYDAELGESIFEVLNEDEKQIHTGTYKDCVIWSYDHLLSIKEA